MSMYAIQDTTLTALGDAVRNKTSKYISVEEKGEPFFIATGSTADLEMVGYDNIANRNWYAIPIDFRAMLKADVATKWYIEFTFESCDVAGPMSAAIKFFTNTQQDITSNINRDSICETQQDTTIKSGNRSISIIDTFKTAYLVVGMNPNYESQGQSIAYNVKIWACDSNDKFIELNKYTPLEMVDKINGLMTIPDEAFNITGDCKYRFAYNGWNWFIEKYGDKITTKDIIAPSYMFDSSGKLETIPFDINLKNASSINNMFYYCSKLKNIPMVYGAKLDGSNGYVFYNCAMVRHFPEHFAEDWDFTGLNNYQYGGMSNLFNSCWSLRTPPTAIINNFRSKDVSSYSSSYVNTFSGCLSLDDINGVDVIVDVNATSNMFNAPFTNCSRVLNITFLVNNDGTPKTANWKSQTIDLTSGVGYITNTYYKSYILDYNSGITADKEVKDDATYQALKNDPDWFSCDINYSRYNHDSAVNTINSLPDTSAYLATAGGTNTIKFKGQSGALTDGGAINTLTEEEIAVATAKGWSVALV